MVTTIGIDPHKAPHTAIAIDEARGHGRSIIRDIIEAEEPPPKRSLAVVGATPAHVHAPTACERHHEPARKAAICVAVEFPGHRRTPSQVAAHAKPASTRMTTCAPLSLSLLWG